MNTTMQINEVDSLITQWRDALTRSAEALADGCRALAKAFDLDAKRAQELVDDCPVSPVAIKRMLEVGRGIRNEKLLLNTSAGHEALAKCDPAIQSRYLSDSIEVIEPNEPTQHRLIPIGELSTRQVSQVFGYGRVRTLAEQRTWLQEHGRAVSGRKAEMAYKVIRGGKVEIGGVILTKKQVLAILQEMED